MITVKKFTVNPIQENSYLLYDETGECLVVDAGFYEPEEQDEVLDFIRQNGLKPVGLINTHCHFDHIMGVEFLRHRFDIPFLCHQNDDFWLARASLQASLWGFEMEDIQPADRHLSDGELVTFGHSSLKVIHVPGHSPGHVTFYSAESGFLMAGDVLFCGSIGRTDLPGGNYDQLIAAIKDRLLVLPQLTKVYSGHGPETTIGGEKQNNPFLT